MKVSRGRYTKADRSHALAVNIRLQKKGAKPTRNDVLSALRFILRHGRVPEGWRFAAIDWSRPTGGSKGWREGDISDMMGNLHSVLGVMIEDARIGIVRKGQG